MLGKPKNVQMKAFDIFKDEGLGCYQVRTKSVILTISFDDREKETIFNAIVERYRTDEKVSLDILRDELMRNHSQEKIMEVIHNLRQNSLIEDDTLGVDALSGLPERMRKEWKRVGETDLLIYGSGGIAARLYEGAKELGFRSVKLRLFDNEIIKEDIQNAHFVVYDASCWSPVHVEEVNRLAIKYRKPWLYVEGANGRFLKIGPLFHGRETGCYNCLVGRVKSNNSHPELVESYERFLKDNRVASKPDRINFECSINAIVANLSLMEVTKYVELWSVPMTWRTIIKLDYLKMEISHHSLLKMPYCKECRPELDYNISPWLEAVTLNDQL